MPEYSVNPAGERFPLPERGEYSNEFERLTNLAREARSEGKEIVVVMGVGFVGAVMAAIVADSVDKKTGKPGKLVIGCQRPSTRSYWKIPMLNRGVSPVKAEDPEVDQIIRRVRPRQENTHRHLHRRLPHARRLRGGGRAMRLHQARFRQHAFGRGGDGRTRGDATDDRREDSAAVSHAHRDHRGSGNDGVRSLAHPLEGFRRARHRDDAFARAQLRARDAGARVRGQHPRLLESLQRLHAGG